MAEVLLLTDKYLLILHHSLWITTFHNLNSSKEDNTKHIIQLINIVTSWRMPCLRDLSEKFVLVLKGPSVFRALSEGYFFGCRYLSSFGVTYTYSTIQSPDHDRVTELLLFLSRRRSLEQGSMIGWSSRAKGV